MARVGTGMGDIKILDGPSQLTLVRGKSTPQGTPGALYRQDRARLCYTLELPWKDNVHGISCIPTGEYVCVMKMSPKFGPVYEVTGVPGRTSILIHTGNFAGDVAAGYKSHVLGCILLGLYMGSLTGQLAVMVSRPAVTALSSYEAGNRFTLGISWASSIS